uniref:Uncharacterized protein n=1 Tax=Zonotrichia albicollis TaxID=44394 RepID=A0A8D2QBL2_ZONAL
QKETRLCSLKCVLLFSSFLLRQLMANEPLEKLGFKDLINEKSEEKPKKS